ncbi:hypothetical protein [Halalkalicoccus ordinarius]|uniref:hypothetical protein n=1 Tax=Halalkalicoccus ordinarius TaxID=3116651 RepID=UPI00300F412F
MTGGDSGLANARAHEPDRVLPPKAALPERRRENWDVLDLELSGAMERIFEAHIGLDEERRSLLGY